MDALRVPEAPPRAEATASRAGVLLATVFGLGYVPLAPGTAGSFAAAVAFALLTLGLDGTALRVSYLVVLAGLAPAAMWATEQALPLWKTADPQPVVIDEVLGQWIAYGGLLLPAAGFSLGWYYLGAGFILFRVFDVLKPFPIRRAERLPRAAGVVLDDVVAGLYAAAVLVALSWSGWLK